MFLPFFFFSLPFSFICALWEPGCLIDSRLVVFSRLQRYYRSAVWRRQDPKVISGSYTETVSKSQKLALWESSAALQKPRGTWRALCTCGSCACVLCTPSVEVCWGVIPPVLQLGIRPDLGGDWGHHDYKVVRTQHMSGVLWNTIPNRGMALM